MVTIDEIAWYPLRITYSQEMKVKEYLDKEHIESFIPMRYVEKECQGKKTRQLVPAIHNLLFIRENMSEFARCHYFSLLSSKSFSVRCISSVLLCLRSFFTGSIIIGIKT